MKKFFTKLGVMLLLAASSVVAAVDRAVSNAFTPSAMGFRLKQGGFVLLSRPYAGYAAGTVVELTTSLEAALVSSGGAVASNGPPTPGSVTTTMLQGRAAIAAGQSSLQINNSFCTPQSIVYATLCTGPADATFTSILRVNVDVNGQFTIVGNAAATAATSIKWAILNPTGTLTSPT